jgi:AcrR family transcriptional regulator
VPHPAQTEKAAIITTARSMIEQRGVAGLTLARLATTLGVKAPSLYHHVTSRDSLLRAVNDLTLELLMAAYQAAVAAAPTDPAHRLVAVAQAHRHFGLHNPHTYTLSFATPAEPQRPELTLRGPLLEITSGLMAELVGPARAITALRGLFALIHGFVMLEINGQFQLGGDRDAAFAEVLAVYLRGLTAG